jgi:hypothetical protein
MSLFVRPSLSALVVFLASSLSFGVCLSVEAQSSGKIQQADRVVAASGVGGITRLSGHVAPWAKSANDAGAVSSDTPLRLTFVLSRSAEMQAAFTQFLADQQNPSSPSYHHWLTPQEIGQEYGPTQHDLDALSAWLTSRGLAIVETAPSRTFLTVKGSTAAVSAALGTSFRYFNLAEPSISDAAPLQTKRVIAATAEPAVPTTFAPIVASIRGLGDAPLQPMLHMQARRLNSSVGSESKSSLESDAKSLQPALTLNNGDHFVTPGDFSTIFDVSPVYGAGINGEGQKVAIIGRSRVVATDVSEYETNTGLSPNLPNVIIPPSGTDPGVAQGGDEGEALLDVDRLIGTAPGVHADLVVSASDQNADGIEIAAEYEIQTLVDPVMNMSFGGCEVYGGAGFVSYWDTLFAQAAAEGISVFISSSDSGAATCSAQFSTPETYQFRSINGICASSYATCLGGTEFADTADPALYWSSSNGSDLASAMQYIPEGAWNEPTSQDSNGNTIYVDTSTGGGASLFVAKPSWQTAPGVPADGARDVPDLSFPAAGHDGYYACEADAGGDCSKGYFEYFFGTSAAAPGMSGITALLNQKTGGSQGNMNPILYRIYASTPAAFHDATPATSGVASCDTGTPSMCNNSDPSPTGLTGGLAGYALTTGYDQATGLGSLDVNQFITAAAASATSTLTPTSLSLADNVGNTSTITNSQTAVFTATIGSTGAGTPTGTVQFYANTTAIGSPIALSGGVATTAAVPFPAAGDYLVTAVYSGDTTFAASTAPGIEVYVTGINPTVNVTESASSISISQAATFTASVVPPGTGTPTPTGFIEFYASSTNASGDVDTVKLTNGSATTASVIFPATGTYTVYANYSGDSVYSQVYGSSTITVVSGGAYQLSVASPTLSLSAGASTGNTDTVNIGVTNGFTGTVSLACSVAYKGTGTVNDLPTCGFASSALTVNGTATSTVLTVGTVATHAVKSGSTFGFLKGASGMGMTGVALAGLVLCILPVRRSSRSAWRAFLLLFAFTASIGLLSGCGSGGGGGSSPAPVPGTTAGSYSITVTASSNVSGVAAPSPVTIALTVN